MCLFESSHKILIDNHCARAAVSDKWEKHLLYTTAFGEVRSQARLVNLEKRHSEIPPFDPNGPIWELNATFGKGTLVPQMSDTVTLHCAKQCVNSEFEDHSLKLTISALSNVSIFNSSPGAANPQQLPKEDYLSNKS